MTHDDTPSNDHDALTRVRDAGERAELRAAVSFVELVSQGYMTPSALQSWFEAHLVSSGCMTAPATVHQRDTQRRDHVFRFDRPQAMGSSFELIVKLAQRRVTETLARLRGPHSDDRFFLSLIYRGRVERLSARGRGFWMPRPRPTDELSDIVLAVIAADVLEHRTSYDESIHACRRCGAIGFDDSAPSDECSRGKCRAAVRTTAKNIARQSQPASAA